MNTASDETTKPRTYSKLAMTCFLLGIVPGIVIGLLALGDHYLENGTQFESIVSYSFYIFSLFIAPVLHIIGLILGFIGVFRKNLREVLSIFGLICNGVGLIILIIVWIVVIFFIGLLAIVGPVPVR